MMVVGSAATLLSAFGSSWVALTEAIALIVPAVVGCVDEDRDGVMRYLCCRENPDCSSPRRTPFRSANRYRPPGRISLPLVADWLTIMEDAGSGPALWTAME